MKLLISITLLLCALAIPAFAQTVQSPNPALDAIPSFTLPAGIAVGGAFNQVGSPRVNLFATAIVPVKADLGLYATTTADIVPVARLDAATSRTFYTFQTTLRQGLHKTVYARGRFMALLGGDAGAAFSQALPSGTNVNLATSLTVTGVYQFSKEFGVIVPVRGLWTPQLGWAVIPEVGILWRP